MARTISEVFSLSPEEASDLVSNTPIILLDNLTRSLAAKVKEYFRGAGAEIILTNDIFYKRKCYRTVWPDPPNLSFLHKLQQEEKAGEKEEALPAEEALQEIRSLQTEPPPVPRHEPEAPRMGLHEKAHKQLIEELDRWRQECMSRRAEVEKLQTALEKIQKNPGTDGHSKDSPAHEKDKRVRELMASLAGADEKYDALKEEYRQARLFFEEKIASVIRQRGDDGKVKDLEQHLRVQIEKNRALERNLEAAKSAQTQGGASEALTQERAANESLRRDNSQLVEANKRLDHEVQDKAKQLENLKAQTNRQGSALEELEGGVKNLDSLRKQLESALGEKEKMRQAAREQADLLELKLEDAQKDLGLWKDRALEMEKRLQQLEENKNTLAHTVENYRLAEDENRGQYEEIQVKYQEMLAQRDKDQLKALKYEDALKNLEVSLKEAAAQIELKTQKIAELEVRLSGQDKEIAALRETKTGLERLFQQNAHALKEKEQALDASSREKEMFLARIDERDRSFLSLQAVARGFEEELKRIKAAQEEQVRFLQEAKSLQLRVRELEELNQAKQQALQDFHKDALEKAKLAEAKDREIDFLKRQLQNVHDQNEQRELLQKRTQLVAQLGQKEEQLKRLVEQQGRIETEIRQREETMRQILTQQESLEKEIVESKQAQRHMLEHAKKSKAAPGKETPSHD
ncbi:MAG TPA: hypothetical protein VL688_05385 [Verrucomicrobiae bacterium]|nr:hypothetical protein [Verrucomicrobiae bacterium]